MSNVAKDCEILVPLRVNLGRLETMMGRRSFINPHTRVIMSFPGEWAFFGGEKKPEEDQRPGDAAVREFGEETGYWRLLNGLFQLRDSVEHTYKGIDYCLDFYASWFGSDVHIPLNGDGEVLVQGWMRPESWIYLINSIEFDRQQIELFKRKKLVYSGGRALVKRQMPVQQIVTLSYLIEHEQELLTRYNTLEDKPAARPLMPLFTTL